MAGQDHMTTERETLTAYGNELERLLVTYAEQCIEYGRDPANATKNGCDYGHRSSTRAQILHRVAELRATPPAEGPVVYIQRHAATATFDIHMGDPNGADSYVLGTLYPDKADSTMLGLAPGECKRVRLTVEGETE